MIQNVYSQPQEFILSMSIGVILALLYEITNIAKLFKKHKILYAAIIDGIFCIFAIIIYVILNFIFIKLNITFYAILGNIIGFIICRKSIAILLAKFYEMLYNLYKRYRRKNNGQNDG